MGSPIRQTLTRYIIRLIPITPIHVWSGLNAVVNIDAFTRGNYLYVLSEQDLEKLSQEDLNRLMQMRSTELSTHAFNVLISRGLIKPLAELKSRTTLSHGVQVRLLHKNVIPGSTLKGYIRTAIIRYLMTSRPTSEMINLIKTGINTTREPKSVSEGLEAALLRRPRLKRQGGFTDAMETLLVSDPKIVNVKFSVRELYVVHKFNLKDVIAKNVAVVLDPNPTDPNIEALNYDVTVFEFQTSAESISAPHNVETSLISLRDIVELKKTMTLSLTNRKFLLDVLRLHGCKLIELELEKCHEELVEYRKLLINLKNMLCSGEYSCVPARIGFMTGHESKTVLDLIKQHAPDIFKDVASLMHQHVKRVWDALTLKLVDYDGKLLGVGWCKLCIEG